MRDSPVRVLVMVDQAVPVEQLIMTVRGQRVVLAADLARIYGVETRVLNQAIRRNRDRFPSDFAFILTRDEAEQVQRSRSQSVILKRGQNVKYLPLAFTEHGAVMAATVLSSPSAVQMSIFVVRAFLKLREYAAAHTELERRLQELEKRVDGHDQELRTVIQSLRHLLHPPKEAPRRKLGFTRDL